MKICTSVFAAVPRFLFGATCLFVVSAVAHADHPHWTEDSGANAPPVGSHLISPVAPGNTKPGKASSFNGAMNGFGVTGTPGPGAILDLTNPASIAITHNPNCPLHPDYIPPAP